MTEFIIFTTDTLENRDALSEGVQGVHCEFAGAVEDSGLDRSVVEAMEAVLPWQMLLASVEVYGGGAINAFARQHDHKHASGFVRYRP